MKRTGLSKKTRFEVFKRDSFACQYCGQKSPDVVLEVDHINPVSKGGKNNHLNLITACKGCNAGKSNRELSDDSVIRKQQAQIEDLQERKEQLAMMYEWQKGLFNIESRSVEMLAEFWADKAPGYFANENGKKTLKKILKEGYSIAEIMAAIDATTRYFKEDKDGKITKESIEIGFKKIGAICWMRRQEIDNPSLAKAYYLRGVLSRKLRLYGAQMPDAITTIKAALDKGVNEDDIKRACSTASYWNNWLQVIRSL